jgi:type I restriction enzyme S subunit
MMNVRLLKDIISIEKGRKHQLSSNLTTTSKRVFQATDLRNNENIQYTNEANGVETKNNDILMVWDGSGSGNVAFGKVGYVGSTIARLRIISEDFHPEFLYHFLKSKVGFLRKRAVGATIMHISRRTLESILVPEIDYVDQIKIASILSDIEFIIESRKSNINLIDNFLKNCYLQFFSSVNRQYEKWRIATIEDIALQQKNSIRSGPFGSDLLHSEFSNTGSVRVIGIENVVKNRFDYKVGKFITKKKFEKLRRYQLKGGDVLITIMGTNGRSAIVPHDIETSINTKHIAAITVDAKVVDPVYVSHSIFNSPYVVAQLKRKTKGAIMAGLNLTIIKATRIKIPPIALQKKFNAIVENYNAIVELYEDSIEETESLYQNAYHSLVIRRDDSLAGVLKELENSRKQRLSRDLPNEAHLREQPMEAPKRTDISAESALLSIIEKEFGNTYFSFDEISAKTKSGRNGFHEFESIRNTLFILLRDKKVKQVFLDSTFIASLPEKEQQAIKDGSYQEKIYLQKMRSK